MNDIVQTDMNRALMLDGNAVAGTLYEVFSMEMTTSLAECVHCSNQSEMGELLAFTHTPGLVLRCPQCESIVLRIVVAPDAFYLDARGAMYLRLASQ
jgi:Zn finger protein HypA/HybF involved in hydrogenase expression